MRKTTFITSFESGWSCDGASQDSRVSPTLRSFCDQIDDETDGFVVSNRFDVVQVQRRTRHGNARDNSFQVRLTGRRWIGGGIQWSDSWLLGV